MGSDDDLMSLRSALGPHELGFVDARWLRATHIEPEDVLRAQQNDLAVRCFIDLSALPRVRLYFADRSAQHFLAREVNLNGGIDALGREELGQIVASSIEVLLENAASGMNREQMTSVLAQEPRPSTPAPEPAPLPAERKRPVTLELGAFYAIQAFARNIALSHGPGVFGTVAAPYKTIRPSLRWSGQFVLPQQFEDSLVGARLETAAFRLGAGADRDLGERVRAGLWLGIGIDVVHLAPRQGSAEAAELTKARYSQATLINAVAELRVRIARDVCITGAVVADQDFRPRHYDLTTPDGVTRVLEPWKVRPGLVLGFGTWR